MRVFIKYEVDRMKKNRWWLLSLIIGCSITIADLLYFISFYGTKKYSLIQAWIGTDYQFAFNSMYYVMLPIIACLPHAGTYYLDLNNGYIKNICTYIHRKKYYIGKVLVSFVSAALAVMFPLLINLFICLSIYPMREVEKLEFLSAGIIDRNILAIIFQKNQLLYCFLYILIAGWFAGMISLIPIIIAENVDNFFNVIMVPFVLYIVQGIVFMGDETGNWSLIEMVNPVQRCVTKLSQLITVGFGGLIIMLIFIHMKGRKKDFI